MNTRVIIYYAAATQIISSVFITRCIPGLKTILKLKPKKMDTGNKFQIETVKNWKPLLNSKPKTEKIGNRFFFSLTSF